jgi:hypothetical protein
MIGTPLVPSSLGAVITASGSKSALELTTLTTLKTSGGRVMAVSVIVAGSAVGTVYDGTKIVAVIPQEVGVYMIDFPCFTNIRVLPPTGATISVSYC